jgi:hypothetical protein
VRRPEAPQDERQAEESAVLLDRGVRQRRVSREKRRRSSQTGERRPVASIGATSRSAVGSQRLEQLNLARVIDRVAGDPEHEIEPLDC